MSALKAGEHGLVHISGIRNINGLGLAAGPASLSAGVIQLEDRGQGDGSLACGVAIGQQHSNLARAGEQHGIQALFGGEGGEAGSHSDVQGVGLVVVAVGNGDRIFILNFDLGIAVLHASNIGTIGNCSAAISPHRSGSTIGQHHVADGVLGIGGIVRNGYVDEVNANVHFANVGNSVAVNSAVQSELQDLGVSRSLHRGQLHSVVLAHLGIGSIGHRELDGHVALGIGVLVAVHLEIDHRAIIHITVSGSSGGGIGVIHPILRPHYQLQLNCLRASAVSTGKGIAVPGKQDRFVVH